MLFLEKIFDIEILKLLYDLYNKKLVHPSMFYKNLTGLHKPKTKSVLNEACEKYRSKLYNKTSKFNIDTTHQTLPVIFDNKTGQYEKIDDREIAGCPNLDFININLSKCSITKFEQLARIYNTTAVFLLNELHLKIDDIAKLTPAGFKIYVGEPDSEKQAYTAIMVKEELSRYIEQIKVPNFFTKIKFKHEKFKCFFTSVYRPNNNSIKYKIRTPYSVNDFYIQLKNISSNSKEFSDIICGDFNTHFIGPKVNKTALKKLNNCMPGHKNLVTKSTYRRFNKSTNKIYESCIDGVYTKNIKLDGFFHLNLKDTISTDGHLGQKGCINFDTQFAQILKPIFSRKLQAQAKFIIVVSLVGTHLKVSLKMKVCRTWKKIQSWPNF